MTKIDKVLHRMTKLDQFIAIKIMEGYSYEEIGKKIGISAMAISKRMRKYSR